MNIFDLLTPEQLAKYTYTKTYKTNEVLFNENQLCERIGYLLKGEVDIVEITYTEKEESITYLKEGDYFGDLLLFSQEPFYLGHAISLKKTTIRYISKDHLLILFKENPLFLKEFLTIISTKALSLKQEIKLFKHKNITDRLIYYLSSKEKKQKTNQIRIKNVTALAKTLSIPRPSLAREITKLEKKHIISKIKKDGYLYLTLHDPSSNLR